MEAKEQQLTFSFRVEGTGRQEVSPDRYAAKHGSTKWWKGRIHVEGVTLFVHASPTGIAIPTGVTLDDELRERIESYLTREAIRLNRRSRREGCRP
jgi:hypothetical protein